MRFSGGKFQIIVTKCPDVQVVVIDIAQKKVIDVINKDDALTFIQMTADALHRHIYLLNIKSDKPLVWAR